MEETAAKTIKKGQNSFEIFLEIFLSDIFNVEDTLGSNFIRTLLYEYIRILRKRERKTGVF